MSHSLSAEQIERWLVEHLTDTSGEVARLPRSSTRAELSPPARCPRPSPSLAEAARRLSAYDQFRLTLELVRTAPVLRELLVDAPARGRHVPCGTTADAGPGVIPDDPSHDRVD